MGPNHSERDLSGPQKIKPSHHATEQFRSWVWTQGASAGASAGASCSQLHGSRFAAAEGGHWPPGPSTRSAPRGHERGAVPTLPAAWTDPGHRGSVRRRTHEATRHVTAPTRHVQGRRVHWDRKWARGRQELRRGRGLPFWKMEGSRNGWGAGCTTVTVLNPT